MYAHQNFIVAVVDTLAGFNLKVKITQETHNFILLREELGRGQYPDSGQ